MLQDLDDQWVIAKSRQTLPTVPMRLLKTYEEFQQAGRPSDFECNVTFSTFNDDGIHKLTIGPKQIIVRRNPIERNIETYIIVNDDDMKEAAVIVFDNGE